MERIGVFFFLFLHRFPEQGCRGSLMNLDFYELTYMIVLLVKDNHLVLAGSIQFPTYLSEGSHWLEPLFSAFYLSFGTFQLLSFNY